MPLQLAHSLYQRLAAVLPEARQQTGRPLTLTEKLLAGHAAPLPAMAAPEPGVLFLLPDRVALQDATAQMALLQFLQAGRDRVALPASIHCDHLIQAQAGAGPDLARGLAEHQEVFAFLGSAARKYGLDFWPPGAGIIHQVVLENYAFPGGLLLGTDSHTPNAGGLGCLGIGVGGADAAEVLAGLPWELPRPRRLGVRLTGRLTGWATPKDVILRLLAELTVRGGTHKILEYFGDGAASLSATGRATICNMGAELGATSSLFPYDARTARYLVATGRGELATLADAHQASLTADPEVLAAPAGFFDELLEIDLTTLAPQVAGPHTPDRVTPVGDLAAAVREHGWPPELGACLVGSCTNSSTEDLGRAASLLRQARDAGLRPRVPLFVAPGSARVARTLERDGVLAAFAEAGATRLAAACGPCIGQWARSVADPARPDSILSSFNRNFPGRNDGRRTTCSFLASPELTVAYAFSGRLDVDPRTAELTPGFTFQPPTGPELPAGGLAADVADAAQVVHPPAEGHAVVLEIAPDSERLALLTPFPPWDGEDLQELPVLLKARGKTTTDAISPAGPWLRFRGHLDRISDNLCAGALNAFTGETGTGTNVISGEKNQSFSAIARDYQRRGLGCAVVGDANYGEGSSREHAAMSPRHLGVKVVLARSFARIHETNLKKQGILPLTFADPADWEQVQADDRLSVLGLRELTPGQPVTVRLTRADGTHVDLRAHHGLTRRQLAWFWAGSALNTQRPQP
ncbi:MAG: aconitate hydratase [Myxococcota bacterium]|jgi:aconitate hydratase|nr:aconitate hydratase [Myxococcota bacterium]